MDQMSDGGVSTGRLEQGCLGVRQACCGTAVFKISGRGMFWSPGDAITAMAMFGQSLVSGCSFVSRQSSQGEEQGLERWRLGGLYSVRTYVGIDLPLWDLLVAITSQIGPQSFAKMFGAG